MKRPFKALIRAAVALNTSKPAKASPARAQIKEFKLNADWLANACPILSMMTISTEARAQS